MTDSSPRVADGTTVGDSRAGKVVSSTVLDVVVIVHADVVDIAGSRVARNTAANLFIERRVSEMSGLSSVTGIPQWLNSRSMCRLRTLQDLQHHPDPRTACSNCSTM